MVYLDNAATSWPKPYAVYNEIVQCIKKYGANPGRSGHKMSIMASEKIHECRENLARIFGIRNPLCITFTGNTTEAINMGIKGLLKAGDHVITTSMEHNSVIRPLKKLEASGVGISIVTANKQGYVNPRDIQSSINEKTKLIVTIHASNVTGTINPVAEIGRIARANNVVYMVDAAQTAGVYQVDVNKMNIDILAFPGHKGLLGPQGTGGLYVREGLVLDTLMEGGTGSMSESPFQPDFSPDRYESGTLNTPGIAALNEGVKFLLDNEVKDIRREEKNLMRHLLDGLYDIRKVKVYGTGDINKQVGTVSINIGEKDCISVCNELDEEYGIAVRGGLHCASLAHQTIGTFETGTVRMSIGCFNTQKDIDFVLDAIKRIAKKS